MYAFYRVFENKPIGFWHDVLCREVIVLPRTSSGVPDPWNREVLRGKLFHAKRFIFM